MALTFSQSALRSDTEHTPLQLKLNNLAELIAKIGSLAGLLLFVALLIRFFVQLGTGIPIRYLFHSFYRLGLPYAHFSYYRTSSQKGIAFVNILIISVTVIVVAVPEGLSYTPCFISNSLMNLPTYLFRSPARRDSGTCLCHQAHDVRKAARPRTWVL